VASRSAKAKKLIEHRNPTPATVRQLYGTAFECGEPGCHEDLYKVREEAGERILNSHVAHIHARSEGGPRWDPDMSEADNRDSGNLLLLCLFHAWEVDQIPDQYPADLLRRWKSAQLADYRRVRKSWIVTDAEALEALAPFDLAAAIEKLAAVVPFNLRMRSRVEAWQHAVRKGRGRRVARLTPLVVAERREAVLAWIGTRDDPVVDVPAGQGVDRPNGLMQQCPSRTETSVEHGGAVAYGPALTAGAPLGSAVLWCIVDEGSADPTRPDASHRAIRRHSSTPQPGPRDRSECEDRRFVRDRSAGVQRAGHCVTGPP
jgi:hypothetical protein